jgi:hypothetical protein
MGPAHLDCNRVELVYGAQFLRHLYSKKKKSFGIDKMTPNLARLTFPIFQPQFSIYTRKMKTLRYEIENILDARTTPSCPDTRIVDSQPEPLLLLISPATDLVSAPARLYPAHVILQG